MDTPTKIIPRQDLQAFLDLIGIDVAWSYRISRGQISPRNINSQLHLRFPLPETKVEAELHLTMLEKRGNAYYYSHSTENFTHVRVPIHFGPAFSFFGKGARASETWAESRGLLDLLVGDTRGIEQETQVTF